MRFIEVYKREMLSKLCEICRPPLEVIIYMVIEYYGDRFPAYFDNIYNYVADNGYANMRTWIKQAARKHGK